MFSWPRSVRKKHHATPEMAKPAEQTPFTRALHEIHADGVATTREMARAADCSERHMRHVVSMCDPTQISLEKALRLSSWLVDDRDETRQLDGFLGLTGGVHFRPDSVDNDDCIEGEIFRSRNHAGNASRLLEEGDREGAAREMRQSIREGKAALTDIQEPAES